MASASSLPARFDVVIIGGGPSGCVAGALLARRGFSVAVVDRARPSRFCIGETLPPQATHVLRELGLMEEFQAQGHRPSPGIVSVWGDEEPVAEDFMFSVYGNGWHIDRGKLNGLLKQAATRSGAAYIEATGIDECGRTNQGWRMRASCPGGFLDLRSRVAVDARGRCPGGTLGFSRRTVFDRLIAVAGTFRPAVGSASSDFTLVEAIDEGWFYSALLPNGEFVLSYMTDADLYAAGRQRSQSFFQDQLTKAPRTQARIEFTDQRLVVFSAVTSALEIVTQDDWLAVGDVAQSHDPLCGSGLLMAARRASDVAGIIADLLHGNTTNRSSYERVHSETFAEYRRMHKLYYGREQRWPQSRFWARRQ